MSQGQNAEIAPSLVVHALPAFEDNYLWLLQMGKQAIAVDPGDAEVIQTALKQFNLQLNAILITHHHNDHIDGVADLYTSYHCNIYAPFNSPLKQPHTVVGAQQAPDLSSFGLQCQVLELPGHTLDHIAYLIRHNDTNQTHLFSGDVLFSAGCGRIFEGTYAQMWASLQTIQRLPQETLIYPAHEYTLKNLQFAKQVEPDNQAIRRYEQQCLNLRERNLPTLPTNVSTELAINPFLRCSKVGDGYQELDKFTYLRKLRNTF